MKKVKVIVMCISLGLVSAATFSANSATVTDTFKVLITITKACSVVAGSGSDINLGSVASTATNASATNNITINCSKTTPYFIGLSPSAANGGGTTGAGAMSSVANSAINTDKVPYQLNRTSATGPVWGNTATSTEVGNGFAGTGNGANQVIPVYATAASANFTPDSYADTVTVTVNY